MHFVLSLWLCVFILQTTQLDAFHAAAFTTATSDNTTTKRSFLFVVSRTTVTRPPSYSINECTRTITTSTRRQPVSQHALYSVNDHKSSSSQEDDIEDNIIMIPKDMKYNEYNLMRQNKHFLAIRAVGGSEMTNDIYARDPDTDVFWFVGKVARISDVSVEKAVARQYPLIEEHSARLRPLELFDKKGRLELWAAPGDSELDVAYNRPHVMFVKMARAHEIKGVVVEDVRNVEVGFQGEIYEGGEEGFRTQRRQDGSPLKPEIQQPDK
jgi:hypothetical protein